MQENEKVNKPGDPPAGEPLDKFMPVAVDQVDDKAHLERARPYTAVEEYLQMASGAVGN